MTPGGGCQKRTAVGESRGQPWDDYKTREGKRSMTRSSDSVGRTGFLLEMQKRNVQDGIRKSQELNHCVDRGARNGTCNGASSHRFSEGGVGHIQLNVFGAHTRGQLLGKETR